MIDRWMGALDKWVAFARYHTLYVYKFIYRLLLGRERLDRMNLRVYIHFVDVGAGGVHG